MTNISQPRRAHLEFLDAVRSYELEVARGYLPVSEEPNAPARLLELGAGTGVQAQRLSKLGYKVSALDLQGSSYRDLRCFEILEYDGINIPHKDRSQDIVFSSHVLEHVVHLDDVLKETHRVLVDDGICIHMIPTSSCRAWTLASHYIWLSRRVARKTFAKGGIDGSEDAPRLPNTVGDWIWTLFPPKHGEKGNTVTEIYYYSQRFWRRKFEESNFHVVNIDSNQLFYTMANATGSSVSIEKRRLLAKILGSACHVYVLKKKTSN